MEGPGQDADGDGNTQIGGDGVVAGRDITQIINQYQGMDEEQLRETIEKILPELLVSKLSEMGIGSQSHAEGKELTSEEEGEVDEALEGAAAAEEAGIEFDPWEYITLGNAARLRGRNFPAEGYYREAMRLFLEAGDREGEAQSINNLGNIAKDRGDLDEAERLHRVSLAINREVGNRVGEATSLNNLGDLEEARGDHDVASEYYEQAKGICTELGLNEDDEE